jgi:hypothetical protein
MTLLMKCSLADWLEYYALSDRLPPQTNPVASLEARRLI